MARFARDWFRAREREAAKVFGSAGIGDGEYAVGYKTDIMNSAEYSSAAGTGWTAASRADSGAGVLRYTGSSATGDVNMFSPGNLGTSVAKAWYFASRIRYVTQPGANSKTHSGAYPRNAQAARFVGVMGGVSTTKFCGGEINAATEAVGTTALSTVDIRYGTTDADWVLLEGWNDGAADTTFKFRVDGEPWVSVTGLTSIGTSTDVGRLPWLISSLPGAAVNDVLEVDKYIWCAEV